MLKADLGRPKLGDFPSLDCPYPSQPPYSGPISPRSRCSMYCPKPAVVPEGYEHLGHADERGKTCYGLYPRPLNGCLGLFVTAIAQLQCFQARTTKSCITMILYIFNYMTIAV